MSAAAFVQTDGGRAAAGFRGKTGDCVTRAIAIATGRPYAEVYALVNGAAAGERSRRGGRRRSAARTGVYNVTTRRIMAELGWIWTATMTIGSGCRVHLTPTELPAGRLVVAVSRHVVAVLDGVVHDDHDPTRGGRRCVYGYWAAPLGQENPR
jgi:hypothetical protein